MDGFTNEYANRSVLQLTALIMPGVTVMNLEDSESESSDGEESDAEEDEGVKANSGKRKRKVTRQLSAREAITHSRSQKKAKVDDQSQQEENSCSSVATTFCKNKLESLDINDTVWENEFCEMTSLIQ